jgi:hypothetical protein
VGDPGGVAATIASGVSGPIGFSGRGDRAGIRADSAGDRAWRAGHAGQAGGKPPGSAGASPMSGRRRLGVAVSAVAAVSVISAGASALAASHAADENYQGPARAAHAVTITHGTNYHGPARTSARVPGGRLSNLPSAAARPRPTQKGSK